jgi:hypothetical protein
MTHFQPSFLYLPNINQTGSFLMNVSFPHTQNQNTGAFQLKSKHRSVSIMSISSHTSTNKYITFAIKDNQKDVTLPFSIGLSNSNHYKMPKMGIKNINFELAIGGDLEDKKGSNLRQCEPQMNPIKDSDMYTNIHPSISQDNKNVLTNALNFKESQKNYVLTSLTKKQIKILEDAISHSDYKTGRLFTTKKGTASRLKCSRMTVHSAYIEFEKRGFMLRGKQKKGKNGSWGVCSDILNLGNVTVSNLILHTVAKATNKTNNITSHSEELEIRKVKVPYKLKDPHKEIVVKDSWPNREAQKFLDKEVGKSYLRQETIIKEYNMLLISQGKEKMLLREYNYGFFPFMKQRKRLQGLYGERRIPLAKHLAWKEKPEIKTKPEIEIKSQKSVFVHPEILLRNTEWSEAVPASAFADLIKQLSN